MSSPTPIHGITRPLLASTPYSPRQKGTLRSSSGVLKGIKAWQRKSKSTSSTASSGKGLGMGMAGTPAKAGRHPSAALSWHSTPLAQRSSRRRSSSSDSPDFDISLPSFISSETTNRDQASSLPSADSYPIQELGGMETLFPDLQDFLVPLNDVSEDESTGQLQETLLLQVNLNSNEGYHSQLDNAEDGSVELARGSCVALDDRDFTTPPLNDHPALEDNGDGAHASTLEAVNKRCNGDERAVEMLRDQASQYSQYKEPWLAPSPCLACRGSSSPPFPSYLRYTPPSSPPTSPIASGCPSQIYSDTSDSASPAPDISEQETIRPGKRKKYPAWRGARLLSQLQFGTSRYSSKAASEDEDEHSSDSENSVSGLGRTLRRTTCERYTTPVYSDSYEAGRLRRIAHYEDLERNYKLAEEWVLW